MYALKMPEQLVIELIKKELKNCYNKSNSRYDIRPLNSISKLPIFIKIKIKNVKAPIRVDSDGSDKMVFGLDHRFLLTITPSYPYQPPELTWLSEIFHPNIKHPEEGGKLCLKLLKNWDGCIGLSGLIEGIIALLLNPNPLSPLDSPSCTKAAEIMNKNYKINAL